MKATMRSKLFKSAAFFLLLTLFGSRSLQALENTDENEEVSEEASPQNINLAQYKNLDELINAVAPNFLSSNHGIGMAIGVIQNGKPKTYYFGETARGTAKNPTGRHSS
jgi:hypothetical protein